MQQTSAYRRLRTSVSILGLVALLAGCGKGDEESVATTPATGATPPPAAAPAENPEDKRLANAVMTGKTAAAVDLKYDVLVKPAVAQPFEIELTLLPRAAADVLEVEITGIPGLTVAGGGTARFEGVAPGDRHVHRVVVAADGPGLYYVGVTARMATKVQTDVRTFSVPVVVGAVPAAEKPAPVQDATGQAVQPMPAAESGTPAEPKPQ
jgi:hypothetical protein